MKRLSNSNPWPRTCLALMLAGLASAPALAQDEDARIRLLEARVAQLEALVHDLLHEHRPPLDVAEIEDMAEEVAEARTTEILTAHHEEEDEMARRHSYKFGGYVKLDALYSEFGAGAVAGDSAGRDFYLPATIPVGPANATGESYLDLHAQSSRINFSSAHILDNGLRLGSFVEIDFMLSDTGDERVSNSFQPRLRHAFLTYEEWLFGQTWTTFQNVSALPETLDFIGPAESTIFVRQPLARYTRGPWQFALENPETTLTPYGGGPRIVADDNRVPDLVARYNGGGERASFAVAALLRQLRYEHAAAGVDDATGAWGISLSGVLKTGPRDDLRWMLSSGRGLGRYIGLNTADGAVLDAYGRLQAIDSTGLFGAYRHYWSERWRSNLALGWLWVDNDPALTGPAATRDARSLHLNLIFSPQPQLDLGVEFIYADRETEAGEDGDLQRLQFSARYAY
ncbi:MAG: DcaP family trimeric outer membrane transporter [Xanthomonadales bacterium]|nr:DcaP family trimeric outer membrane transporter [Xanthomonadales bacterium]